jgi:hypothetical protein
LTGAAQVPGVVSSQARAIALLCMVVTFGSGIGTSSDFLHLVGGVPSPIELPHGSPVAERWAQLIKLGNKAAELTYKAAEPERDFLSVLLVVLAVALSFTFVCALRVLRPGGLPREGVRKLLSASALFTAVLRTIEGAVQSALSLRVARAMSSLIGQPGWDDSGSLAVRPYLVHSLVGPPVFFTVAVAGSLLLVAQYFRSARMREWAAVQDRAPH